MTPTTLLTPVTSVPLHAGIKLYRGTHLSLKSLITAVHRVLSCRWNVYVYQPSPVPLASGYSRPKPPIIAHYLDINFYTCN